MLQTFSRYFDHIDVSILIKMYKFRARRYCEEAGGTVHSQGDKRVKYVGIKTTVVRRAKTTTVQECFQMLTERRTQSERVLEGCSMPVRCRLVIQRAYIAITEHVYERG